MLHVRLVDDPLVHKVGHQVLNQPILQERDELFVAEGRRAEGGDASPVAVGQVVGASGWGLENSSGNRMSAASSSKSWMNS